MITKKVFILFAAALPFATTTSFAEEKTKPNVLFISIDDLNDWLGCLDGHPQALTPNIDKLASQGVLFSNAHCASPACRPSRAAVMTGLLPNKTGVWSNDTKSLKELMPDVVTLPQAFNAGGYRTLGTGKLFHSRKNRKGFHEYERVQQRWSPTSYKEATYTDEEFSSKKTDTPRKVITDSQGNKVILPLNGMPSDRKPDKPEPESFDWGPWDVPDVEHGDTQVTNWAIEKLKEEPSEPLFLAIGYYRPHIPLWAPARFFERFKDNPGKLPPFNKTDLNDLSDKAQKIALEALTAGSHASVVKYGEWEKAIEAYLACVTYVDEEIGRLLEALENSPYAENTMIVLWSDHGWHLGEKQHWGKWTAWERSTKVPLIITPPKKDAAKFPTAGTLCERPVSLIDLYPTLMDFCGIDGPNNLDGQSLIPLVKDPKLETGRAVVTSIDIGNYSIRTDQYRLIIYDDGSREFYDLKKDPNEWDNLIDNEDYQDKIRETMDTVLLR